MAHFYFDVCTNGVTVEDEDGVDLLNAATALLEAARTATGLKLGSALIDGEAVVEEESGVSNFTALQEVLKSGRSDRMVFCAFDLLYLGGYDLTQVPLVDRKTLLAGCLDELPAGGSASASTLRLTARRCCRRPAASALKESSRSAR